jgi:hypothetical protein
MLSSSVFRTVVPNHVRKSVINSSKGSTDSLCFFSRYVTSTSMSLVLEVYDSAAGCRTLGGHLG